MGISIFRSEEASMPSRSLANREINIWSVVIFICWLYHFIKRYFIRTLWFYFRFNFKSYYYIIKAYVYVNSNSWYLKIILQSHFNHVHVFLCLFLYDGTKNCFRFVDRLKDRMKWECKTGTYSTWSSIYDHTLYTFGFVYKYCSVGGMVSLHYYYITLPTF